MLDLRPPESWRPIAAGQRLVPGQWIAEWEGPDRASLAVFETLPNPELRNGEATPEATARLLLTDVANRTLNLPEARIEIREMATLGGRPAARFEWVAPGVGDTIAPSGIGRPLAPSGKTLEPTRRIHYLIPRRSDTIHLLWHLPESELARRRPEIEATLKSVSIGDTDAATRAGY